MGPSHIRVVTPGLSNPGPDGYDQQGMPGYDDDISSWRWSRTISTCAGGRPLLVFFLVLMFKRGLTSDRLSMTLRPGKSQEVPDCGYLPPQVNCRWSCSVCLKEGMEMVSTIIIGGLR